MASTRKKQIQGDGQVPRIMLPKKWLGVHGFG